MRWPEKGYHLKAAHRTLRTKNTAATNCKGRTNEIEGDNTRDIVFENPMINGKIITDPKDARFQIKKAAQDIRRFNLRVSQRTETISAVIIRYQDNHVWAFGSGFGGTQPCRQAKHASHRACRFQKSPPRNTFR